VLFRSSDGISRQRRCALTEFEHKSMMPPADPQWQGNKTSGRMTVMVMVTVQPIGWTGVWHENPKPQWIVPLSGRWFVEAMDGARVGAGEISFGADQDCRERNGQRGHRSGTIGDAPAVLMVIQFEDSLPSQSSCPFR
jgi:hypothetical protein